MAAAIIRRLWHHAPVRLARSMALYPVDELETRKVVAPVTNIYPQYNPEVDTTSKTTVTILNQREEEGGILMINGYSPMGFRLNNGVFILGSCVIIAKTALEWKLRDMKSATEESFSLFYMLNPRIDILVLGVGDSGNVLSREILMPLMKNRRLSIELQPTESAVTTYNFLASENRHVAGAFLPVTKMVYDETDLMVKGMRRSIDDTEDTDFSKMGIFSKMKD